MAIDSRYIASLVLQQYLVDKDTGAPLAGGKITFYSATTGEPKSVYTISGNPPDYVFIPLPNPVTLTDVGTFQDNNDNDIIPYYLPFEVDVNGNIANIPELYTVVVQSAGGVPQFTRIGWPPNAEESGSQANLSNLANYIPNGQFLLHNTINPADDNILSGGSTFIAPGGWSFELPGSPGSINSLTFLRIQDWTANPPESPPYQVNVICSTPSGSDNIKSLRIKFNNVNKFANGQPYTFYFSAASNATAANVTINTIKNFGVGGSPEIVTSVAEFNIDTDQQAYSVSFNFGTNAGQTIGTGQTFCAIDIAFNVNQTFNVSLTDFMFVQGNVIITDYLVQTDADTITRSAAGWMDVPDYMGLDAYLPVVNTPYGQTSDHSVVGKIEAHTTTIISPTSTDPIPLGAIMPMDGVAYLSSNYSTLGIPFARLGNVWLNDSPVPNIPKFGTGANFVTAYALAGNATTFRLTVNSSGTGIPYASDGDTGWTFTGGVEYGTSVIGSASLDYTSLNNMANTILAVGNFSSATAPSAGTSGFTINPLSNPDAANGLLAFQNLFAFYVQTVDGASLANPGSTGLYWDFDNAIPTGYRMWFFFTDETAPAAGGNTLIKVTMQTDYTAQDVANIVREVMNAYQQAYITITSVGLGLQGKYWLFSANPASPTNYFVWYNVNGVGVIPTVPGRIGIEVPILGADTEAEILVKTQLALNTYQFATADLNGMFLRGTDTEAVWDLDAAQRWSTVSGISGAIAGTFEYQQFLQHNHAAANAGGSSFGTGGTGQLTTTGNSGGTETRPVNFSVNWAVRY